MKNSIFPLVTALCVTALVAGTADLSQSARSGKRDTSIQTTAKKRLVAFSSEKELELFLRKLAEDARRDSRMVGGIAATPAPQSAPAAALNATADAVSVTNVQHAGVDEGGIVKVHGKHLVVLRRGRLFTIKIGNGDLQPVSAINAYAPDINPAGTWYDEMLVGAHTVVVIGYSYQRGGTEIGLFDIDATGHLQYRSTYHLRSNDYYSSRNYSSRLIGNKLIFYTPLYLYPSLDDPFASLPALRKWRPGTTSREFRRIASATRVYRAASDPRRITERSMHTVTTCDLERSELDCEASVVIGAPGRVFYVSPHSVYVWTTDWSTARNRAESRSMLYQLPLDGSVPGAIQVSASPVDQFSFLESSDRHLNVLVRSNAAGDGMWGAEVAQGDVALLRFPLDSFSDGSVSIPSSHYRALPKPAGYTFQNRFVGDYLLYGTGSGWGRQQRSEGSRVYAVRWAGTATFDLPLAHGVDRIEAIGSDAVVVGTRGRDLHFTAVRLGEPVALAGNYVRQNASQGELRSHGFFYKPDGPRAGVLGLPISRPARPGYKHLFETSAAILFLNNQSLRFHDVGELEAQVEKAKDDGCQASCVDWYGNARPLFVGGRVLALLGYELVEGAWADGRIRETRRVNFAPIYLSSR
jgi:hypothetical protein